MESNVGAHEQITRFLIHSGEFRAGTRRVDYSAFMPDGRGEKSVYRTSGLRNADVAHIGRHYVQTPERIIRAEARVLASAIFATSLTIEPAPHPHPRHANIRGYRCLRPADRILARRIADQAELVVYD